MTETETIEALGEYWHDYIYKEMFYSDGKTAVPKEYLIIRAKERGETVEEMK